MAAAWLEATAGTRFAGLLVATINGCEKKPARVLAFSLCIVGALKEPDTFRGAQAALGHPDFHALVDHLRSTHPVDRTCEAPPPKGGHVAREERGDGRMNGTESRRTSAT